MTNASAPTLAAPPIRRSFYIVGGTLRRDAPCYVERQADAELYAALQHRQFCYVLTSRQMGKSSLMVRTASRLREAGTGVAVLDLTAIGQNVNAEQWYGGLLSQLGQQVDLEDELLEFWEANTELGPLQRWLQTFKRVVLPRYVGPVVCFIDEIDAVLGLPFSTDEFFAGIRELYNFRTEDAELERLTFCLLGVASPSDLIRDTRTTPFNIGQRIELRDFTAAEAAPLAQGLRRGEPLASELLERILYWTGGHPYLTQRLCKAVADDDRAFSARSVDQLCEELFFQRRAREQDDNLLFVRERLLRSEVELASLLTLYARVQQGKRVEDEEMNPLVTVLRLAGVVRVESGLLKPRNRIYARVFDREWVAKNMPDAELQRQRAAYRRGVVRAGAIAALLIALIGASLFVALKQRNFAKTQMMAERRALYAAHMSLAQQNWEYFSNERILGLLQQHIPRPGEPMQEDLRNFEWYHLWQLCHSAKFSLPLQTELNSLSFAPDSQSVAVCGTGSAFWLADVATGKLRRTFVGHTADVSAVAFFPDGRRLASASFDQTARIWDSQTGQVLRTLSGHAAPLWSVAVAPDGQRLATISADGVVKLWEAATGRELRTWRVLNSTGHALAFSPDGKWLAGGDRIIKVWEVATGKEHLSLPVTRAVFNLAFSPGSRWLATPYDGVKVWEVATGKEVARLKGHYGWVYDAAFSPDGKYLATASRDQSVKLWDTVTWEELATIKGHSNNIMSVKFSPDGRWLGTASYDQTLRLWEVGALLKMNRLATANLIASQVLPDALVLAPLAVSPDGARVVAALSERPGSAAGNEAEDAIALRAGFEVRLWDAASGAQILTLEQAGSTIRAVAFAPDGRSFVTGDAAGTAKQWDAATGKLLQTFSGHRAAVYAMAYAPDGSRLATGSADQTVKLWEVTTGRELHTLIGHARAVDKLAFSPDGQRLASNGQDRVVKLWDAATGRELATIQPPTRANHSLCFAPNGRSLLIGGDASIIVWDTVVRREIQRLPGHAREIFALSFAPDGRRLAAASADRTVILWDWTSGQELATLKTPEEYLLALGFARDGRTLTAVSNNFVVKQWHAASAEEVSRPNQ
jgi:WD40 repeat protein